MTAAVPDEVLLLAGPAALPRDNGALVFAAPWEGRVLALAIALVEAFALPWDAYRDRLIAAVAEAPERPYYESVAVAVEALMASLGLVPDPS